MRVDDAQQADDELQTWQREHQDPASPGPAVGSPARFDPFELESVMLNLDAALRIRARHQFFGWTQGTLQSLVEHQLLICALQNEAPARHRSAAGARPGSAACPAADLCLAK